MKSPETTPANLHDLWKSINIALTLNTRYRHFQELYHNDRVAFVHDILPLMGRTITPYQEEILSLFDEGKRRIAIRGPHGLGKTFLASILVHHSILTIPDDAKTITTASAWRQLEKYLWPEVKKTAKHINWTDIGREPYSRDEFLTLAIKLNGGTVEAFAIACDDAETIEGAHAKYLTYIFDEAKAIPRATWNAAEGAFSNANVGKQKNIEFDNIETSDNSNSGYIEDVYSKQLYSSINPVYDKDYMQSKEQLNATISQYNSYKGQQLDSNKEQLNLSTRLNYTQLQQSLDEIEQLNLSYSANRVPNYPDDSLHIRVANDGYTNIPNYSNADIYEAIAFAISTPGEPAGQFYDIHMHKPGYEDWYTRHITVDEAIYAGRISPDWVEQRRKQWGQDSPVFQNRVLGEFADVSDEGIIPLSHIRLAIQRWIQWSQLGKQVPDFGKWVCGVDVARGGEDKTVIGVRKAWVLQNFQVYSKLSTPQCAGYIEKAAMVDSKHINIEIDGIGAGVYDLLKADNIKNAHPITVSNATSWRDHSKELRFANIRAAMWWNLRELLDPTNSNYVKERYGGEIALPPDDRMVLDLCTPKWDIKREATISLESKDSIMRRLGRSPDFGTATCLAFWEPHTGGGVVF